MSLQAQLDDEAIEQLTRVTALMIKADKRTRHNMASVALREILSSRIPLNEMTQKQKEVFENNIIESFEYRGLI